MSDKTCGTCAKGVRHIVTCSDREHQHAGLHQPDDCCRDYAENNDSVERIALDMLQYGIDCVYHGVIVNDEDDGFTATMNEFADRLIAQGIEVPE